MFFEVPSNLVLKFFTPRRWIAFITISWGLVATLMGLVNSYGSLLACRLLLGAVEAGLFPGLNVYLTFFYTKNELALRVGYLFVSAAIAGALGGLLAYGIGHMDGVAGMRGWRWILIIEGLPSVVLGVVTYFVLPNDAPTAWFLDEREKALMEVRRRREYGSTKSSGGIERRDVLRAVTDWKAWAFYVAQFGVDTMLYGEFAVAMTEPVTDGCRVLDVFADYYTGAGDVDDRSGAVAYDTVLFSWCGGVHGHGVLV